MTSTNLTSALLDSSMNKALFWAVEFSVSSNEKIRIINNTVDQTIGGQTYIAIPFDITFDPSNEVGDDRLQLKLSNIDRRVGNFFRNSKGIVIATVKILASDELSTAQKSWPKMRCKSVVETRDVLVISFTTHQLSSLAFPPASITPDVFPGAFK